MKKVIIALNNGVVYSVSCESLTVDTSPFDAIRLEGVSCLSVAASQHEETKSSTLFHSKEFTGQLVFPLSVILCYFSY